MPDGVFSCVPHPLESRLRFSIRAEAFKIKYLETVAGMAFPTRIGEVVGVSDSFVACLGPDEWLLSVLLDAGDTRSAHLRDLATQSECSCVDISAREISIRLTGPTALDAINSGCPSDLSGMPTPSVRRTVYDGTQIVVLRWGQHHFQIDIWRSFAPHLLACLQKSKLGLDFNE
ncbi:MAG TPA: hypothetical protein PLR76_00090 [Hyphomonas sp.]|nr:hypothetical protein [Hyphomonas sp.]